jgi:hypothetical protein
MHISFSPRVIGRAAIVAAALAMVPASGVVETVTVSAQEAVTAEASAITKVIYREDRKRLVISGSGLDEAVTVRVNGREISGERKFKANKNKLRITIEPAQLGLKGTGENRVEVLRNGVALGEATF